jgi:hypothetical protein
MLWISVHMCGVASLVVPIWKSYEYEKENSSSDLTEDYQLEDILLSDQYDEERADFIRHLVKEFSTENLFFFLECQKFSDHFGSETFTKGEISLRAVEIYFQFIANSSPDMVSGLLERDFTFTHY